MLSTEGYSIPDIVKKKKTTKHKTKLKKAAQYPLSTHDVKTRQVGSFGWSWRKNIYYLQILLKTIYSITSKSAHLE